MCIHAGKTCPECGLGEVVELNLCEHHYYWSSDESEWSDHLSLCGSEALALWWECNHCLYRWPLSQEARESARHSLEELVAALD